MYSPVGFLFRPLFEQKLDPKKLCEPLKEEFEKFFMIYSKKNRLKRNAIVGV